MRFGVALLLATCLLLGGRARAAPDLVEVPSLDGANDVPVMLAGHWFRAGGEGARPVVVLLHGCGGQLDAKGRLGPRMHEYAALLNARGWHALALDSFVTRGVREICTVRAGERRITQTQRRLDALGALRWLAAQPGVDAQRLALLGWSNGGSTVLAATNRLHGEVMRAEVKPRAAVAFYPGCEAELARRYAAVAPTLLLVGESDDWTPAPPCRSLADALGSGARVVAYPDAHHGFDGTAPLRHRADVPGGANPGQGVTVGGNPAAREASRREMLAFLREHLAP
jgi:dienelactone hydrolase